LATPGLDDRSHLSPNARSLGVELFDANGNAILNHRFWAIAKVANKRVLEIEKPRIDEFECALPDGVSFPLQVTARWNYRRYCQRMADFVYGPGNVTFPITVLAEQSGIVPES